MTLSPSSPGPSLRKLAYRRIDVFTDQPFGGNPLAVFPEPGALDPEVMQRIAREMNLSETTFVGPPSPEGRAAGCDWRVRIFTPGAELPMAGHPTLGTAFALLRDGRIEGGQVVFEEGVGPVPVRLDAAADGRVRVEMEQPAPSFEPPFEDREGLARSLGIDPADLHPDWPARVASCGVPFLMVPLRGLEAARRARPAPAHWSGTLGARGVHGAMAFCVETENDDCDVHARMFAPALGVTEDPATGSACGPLGAYLLEQGLLGRRDALSLRIEQGLEMGRPSLVEVSVSKTDGAWRVAVAGRCVAMGEGILEIPS
ncbi:MAG: PhzF family phenazine biosynthesis protein [Myxococcota bacterium]